MYVALEDGYTRVQGQEVTYSFSLFLHFQVGYSRTKLNTLVHFPTTNLNMSPYLTSHRTRRPASAVDHRLHPRSSKTLPSKSVRFQDEVTSPKKSPISHSVSSEGKRFHFPWKKHSSKKSSKKEQSKSPEVVLSPPVCDSPSSVRSAPSTLGHRRDQSQRHTTSNLSPHHQGQSPTHYRVNPSTTSLDDGRLDNMYDLYAICNHVGNMSRGHYTACCKSPADGNWYMFDDIHVQPVPEEDLCTPGTYMLFYVRQSLIAQSPLGSSDSSTSSSSSANHWIYHIPQFQLNLGSFDEEELKSTNMNEPAKQQQPRSRLDSANSAVSAPPTVPGRGVSPHLSYPDGGSDVFLSSGGHPSHDSHSAISLPPYQPNRNARAYPGSTLNAYPQPPHYDQAILTSPTRHRLTSGRHPSLRLGKQHARHNTPQMDDSNFRRVSSFHAPKHHRVERYDYDTLPARRHNYHSPVMPSRSIPNMVERSPQFSRAFPDGPSSLPFTQSLQERSSSYSGSRYYSVANGHHALAPKHGAESCV